jgi:type I restriction enzyme S subunit
MRRRAWPFVNSHSTLAEQARIVAEVDRHLSIIREVETEVDANIKRAQALRHATLAKSFYNP